MIHRVMTDEETSKLENHLTTLKENLNIKLNELLDVHEEIKKVEYELNNQKLLIKTFDDVFSK